MLSRVANAVYWMSRYVERAENVARCVDANLQLMLDAVADPEQLWQKLVEATGDHEDFARRYGTATQAKVQRFLVFDAENPNSLLSCLRTARENARSARDTISADMWMELNKFHLLVKAASLENRAVDWSSDFFRTVRLSSHLFWGIADATMTHGLAWHFLQLGRMMERADKISRLMDLQGNTGPGKLEKEAPLDCIYWTAVLRSSSGFEMYCRKHGRVSAQGALEFLMLDRDFPRSIFFCLLGARASLQVICGLPSETFRSPAQRQVGRLCSEIEFASAASIQGIGLHEYVDEFQGKLNRADQAIYEQFFAIRAQSAGAAMLTLPGAV